MDVTYGVLTGKPLCPKDANDLQVLMQQLNKRIITLMEILSIVQASSVVVARGEGGMIVATATIVRVLKLSGSLCFIEDVVVDNNQRGRGIGRGIMEFTLRTVQSYGFNRVELTSRATRVAANTMYKGLGFKRRKTNVYRLDFPK